MHAEAGSLTLTSNTFTNNDTYAVYLNLGSGLTFTHSGNTSSGNAGNGFYMNGSLPTDQTWSTNGDLPFI